MATCPNPNCRRPNKPGANFCVYCGHELDNGPTHNNPLNQRRGNGRSSNNAESIRTVASVLSAIFLICLIVGISTRGCSSKERQASRTSSQAIAEPASEAASSSPMTFGTIQISSTPVGALVYLDGKKTKLRTPATIEHVPVGKHELKLVSNKFGSSTSTVNNVVVEDGGVVSYYLDYIEYMAHVRYLSHDEVWRRTESSDRIVFSKGNCSFCMRRIPSGCFSMQTDKGDLKQVTLSAYSLGETEITQIIWKAIMGANSPSEFKGDDYPVENVSYQDCQRFISELNAQTGEHFRLPTEAEWEYAARGANRAPEFYYAEPYNELPDTSAETSEDRTKPVKSLYPNTIGLFGMSGNVAEWCSDYYGKIKGKKADNPKGPRHGDWRVVRGNNYTRSWNLATGRYPADERIKTSKIGFRLAI